jgi:hypothetical protein
MSQTNFTLLYVRLYNDDGDDDDTGRTTPLQQQDLGQSSPSKKGPGIDPLHCHRCTPTFRLNMKQLSSLLTVCKMRV